MFKSESNRKFNRKTRKRKKENKVKNDQNMYLFNNTVATSKDRVTFCASRPAPTIEFIWCIFRAVLGNNSNSYLIASFRND